MEQQSLINYNQAIHAIKSAILQSRYRAAAFVNREMLSLYFGIGKFISENSRNHFWGTNAIETISARLQQELPGLRGFSPVNIKRMRQFFEEWEQYIQKSDNNKTIIRPSVPDEIQTNILLVNRPLSTDDLFNINFDHFLSIGFTHHYEILVKAKTLEERIFYIANSATAFWSVDKLKYNLKVCLFQKRGSLPNNFEKTIENRNLQK